MIRAMSPMNQMLKINEIFYSVQGEAHSSGFPTVFVRLTGCPLRCSYCDTAYAFKDGNSKTLTDILHSVEQYKTAHVCITGGEPLAQPHVHQLMHLLCEHQYQVSIETSGAFDIAQIDPRVSIVMDIKTPSSNEIHRNLFDNLKHIKPTDQIKFVISDERDFHWAKSILEEKTLHQLCTVWFSPTHPSMPPHQLADLILEHQLPVRFQVQLHKVLWGDTPGK